MRPLAVSLLATSVLAFTLAACSEPFKAELSAGAHEGPDAGSGGSSASGGSASGGAAGASGSASGGANAGGNGTGAGGAHPQGGGGGNTVGDAGHPEPPDTGATELPVPTDGLLLWLRADRGITESGSGRVTIWEDQSPNQLDALQTASNLSPVLVQDGIGSHPSIQFDGADDYLSLPPGFSDFGNGLSVFAVVSATPGTIACSAIVEFSNGSEVDDISFGFWNNMLQYEVSDTYINPGTFETDVPQLVGVVHRTSQALQVRRNGGSEGESQFALPVVVDRAEANVGKTLYGGCGFYGGLIGEILVYDRALTDREVLDLEAALRKRWTCCAG